MEADVLGGLDEEGQGTPHQYHTVESSLTLATIAHTMTSIATAHPASSAITFPLPLITVSFQTNRMLSLTHVDE
jgi:hypothetical protein